MVNGFLDTKKTRPTNLLVSLKKLAVALARYHLQLDSLESSVFRRRRLVFIRRFVLLRRVGKFAQFLL